MIAYYSLALQARTGPVPTSIVHSKDTGYHRLPRSSAKATAEKDQLEDCEPHPVAWSMSFQVLYYMSDLDEHAIVLRRNVTPSALCWISNVNIN